MLLFQPFYSGNSFAGASNVCDEGSAVAGLQGSVTTGAAGRPPYVIPYVVIGKPMSDLCWVCQRNNSHILRAVNVPEEMKSATLLRQEEHLRLAMQQRTEYQAKCAACVELATQHNIK